MKKVKYVMLVISIIIILLILAIIGLKKSDKEILEKQTEEFQPILNETLQEVKHRTNYYITKTIVNKYISYVLEQNVEAIYSILDQTFIEENNLTKENILAKIKVIDVGNLTEDQLAKTKAEIEIEKMYVLDKDSKISSYFVYGNLKATTIKEEEEFNCIVITDNENKTFTILPNEYMKEHQYDKKEVAKKYKTEKQEIQLNQYNKYTYENINDAKIINDYLVKYKNKIVKNIEEAYHLLDEEYRNKKFENMENYKQYVKENIKNILSITIEKYKVDYKDEYTQYTCIDTKGNYYIFRENAIMEYDLFLDTYTVDLPEFIEKYDTADDNTKVGMNTEKFLQALNIKDYNYIYNHLDEQFKNNNFDTFDKFKDYMKNRYPDTYAITYLDASKEKEIYIQPILLTIKDTKEEKEENNIIMKLEENRDFVMSFAILDNEKSE